MQLASKRQTSHQNYNTHKGRRDQHIHRQSQYNATRDRQVHLDWDRQQSYSHLQSTQRTKQMHQYLSNTGDQHYMTQNIIHNTRQHFQAPTQNQFQNSIVSQKQNRNNVQAPWQNYELNHLSHLQLQQPPLPHQQLGLTYTQGGIIKNIMHINLTVDKVGLCLSKCDLLLHVSLWIHQSIPSKLLNTKNR